MLHASLRKKTGTAPAAPPRVTREARPGATALLQHAYGNHTIAGAVRDGLAAPWQPLDLPLRFDMERRLGHDFGAVRVHVDSAATARVNARAFTFGDDVVFARDAWSPHSDEGRGVLAHELTHVAQQRGRVLTMPTRLADANEPAERSADAKPAPDALHRTPARQVSCAPGPLALPGGSSIADPVAVITAAENLANSWIDNAVAEVEFTMSAIRGGAPIAWPTISDVLASSLRLLHINPDRSSTWTGHGVGTAELLVRRLRMIRRTIGAGSFYFTCLGPPSGTIGTCVGSICSGGAAAASCPGSFRTNFCAPFWQLGPVVRGLTIVHESAHNFAAFIGDQGREGNAYCWHRFVTIVGGNVDPFGAHGCPNA
jgi:hypothetical protein